MKTLRVVLYCILGGVVTLCVGFGTGHFFSWWLSGAVLAAAFVPIALFGPRSFWGQFAVIWPALAVITVLCTWSEALIFFPSSASHATRDLVGALTVWTIVALLLAVLARVLRLADDNPMAVPRLTVLGTAAAIVACSVTYVVFYLVFGSITYQYFTHEYYPEAAKIARAMGLWFWGIELARGAVMALSVLPMIYSLRMKRWQVAIAIGLIIWVAGGLAPLLIPNQIMVGRQRFIHIVEILTQNLPLGVAAGLLLRPKEKARTLAVPVSQ